MKRRLKWRRKRRIKGKGMVMFVEWTKSFNTNVRVRIEDMKRNDGTRSNAG